MHTRHTHTIECGAVKKSVTHIFLCNKNFVNMRYILAHNSNGIRFNDKYYSIKFFFQKNEPVILYVFISTNVRCSFMKNP